MNKNVVKMLIVPCCLSMTACGDQATKKRSVAHVDQVTDVVVEKNKAADEPVVPIKQEESVENKVVTLPSGLSYVIQQAAPESAMQPSAGKRVTVHYTGWLDKDGQPGTKFDSSVDRGQKFSFTIGVGQVIKGWDEGVMGMRVGEKRRLMIPSELGYGAYGAGSVIPPHAKLIFDVELFEVK